MSTQKKLYIIAREPVVDETKKNLLHALENYPNKTILCFDPKLNSKNKERLTLKYKESLMRMTGIPLNVIMFDETDPNIVDPSINNCDIFYFKRHGLLENYRNYLKIHNLKENSYNVLLQQIHPPTFIVINHKEKYMKLLEISRGDDDSFYVRFNGDYDVDSIKRFKNAPHGTADIELTKTSEKIKNPYSSLHPNGGVIHSKDFYGKYFIPNLNTSTTNEVVNNSVMFPFCTIIPSQNFESLQDIGPPPPLETSNFNFVEIKGKVSNIVNNGLKAPTFITINTSILETDQTFGLEFWIHKKIPGVDIIGSLNNLQKKNIIGGITLNNSHSELAWTLLIKHVQSKITEPEFNFILQIFNQDEYTMCRIKKAS